LGYPRANMIGELAQLEQEAGGAVLDSVDER
jgi:hypothetical protein